MRMPLLPRTYFRRPPLRLPSAKEISRAYRVSYMVRARRSASSPANFGGELRVHLLRRERRCRKAFGGFGQRRRPCRRLYAPHPVSQPAITAVSMAYRASPTWSDTGNMALPSGPRNAVALPLLLNCDPSCSRLLTPRFMRPVPFSDPASQRCRRYRYRGSLRRPPYV